VAIALTDVIQLAAGPGDDTCAVSGDHTVRCWGDNLFGQLGSEEVACGGDHTCVRTSDDTIKCVGGGTHGELGDGKFYTALPFGSAAAVDALSL
jgi:alpha-tubulin suppressor-like RCC1 family protein